jgi:hypothetical protein
MAQWLFSVYSELSNIMIFLTSLGNKLCIWANLKHSELIDHFAFTVYYVFTTCLAFVHCSFSGHSRSQNVRSAIVHRSQGVRSPFIWWNRTLLGLYYKLSLAHMLSDLFHAFCAILASETCNSVYLMLTACVTLQKGMLTPMHLIFPSH